MKLTTKETQYRTLEEGITKLQEANNSCKYIAEETKKYLEDCKKLVQLNEELGLEKFMEHVKISKELYKIEYLLQVAILDLLRYEHDKDFKKNNDL